MGAPLLTEQPFRRLTGRRRTDWVRGANHNRGVRRHTVTGRGVKWRWLNIGGRCGARERRLRVSFRVGDQSGVGWDCRAWKEVVNLRLHRSEGIHVLQMEGQILHKALLMSPTPKKRAAAQTYSNQSLTITLRNRNSLKTARQHNYSAGTCKSNTHTRSLKQTWQTRHDSVITRPVALIQEVKLAFSRLL